MKLIFTSFFSMLFFVAICQSNSTPTLKSILLQQLKTTHNIKNWFVPVDSAIAGLTPEQANWHDSSENHSIAQLTTHLLFWDSQSLARFKGEKPETFDGNNKETFAPVDEKSWNETIKKLDNVLTELENAIAAADEEKLNKWYEEISNICTHNAYHTGQIMYIRKMKGWWDDEKGVK